MFLAVPNKRDKIRLGYFTSALSGAHKWAELLRSAFPGVANKGKKIRMGYLRTSISRGPTSGQKCKLTCAFSMVHNKGEKIRMGCLNRVVPGPTSGQNCYVYPSF